VPAGRRYFEGALHGRLAADLREVDRPPTSVVAPNRALRAGRHLVGRSAREHSHRRAQAPDWENPERVERGRLQRVPERHQHAPEPLALGRNRHREDAVHAPRRSVESELPSDGVAVEKATVDLPRRRQDPDRDREIESRALLPDVGRRKVHRDALDRKREPRVPDRRRDPVASLPHRAVAEADRRERREPATHVRLDADDVPVDPGHPSRKHRREHGVTSLPRRTPPPCARRRARSRPSRASSR